MSGPSCKLVPTNAWLSAGCAISTVRRSPFASRCCARSTPTPAREPMRLLERRAARPGDRPARHRSCAPDQSDACLGGRPRRKALHASPPQGRHRTAPHGRSWSHDAAHQRRTDRRAPGTPSPRGRALPAPPARESRESRAGAVGSASPGSSAPTVGCHRVCRACGAVGRGSASPRQGWAAHRRSGIHLPRWGARPCCRGQALPDPPAWEGRQSPGGALVTVPLGSPRRPIHVTRGCRAARRRARHTAPLHRLGEHPQQGPCAPRFGGALSAL